MRVVEVGERLGRRATSGIGAWCSRPSSGTWKLACRLKIGLAVLDGHHPSGGERAAVADAVDLVEDRHASGRRAAGSRRAASARARPGSTVRAAATSAWPATWPPNTRWRSSSGESPRKMLTSIGSRSSSSHERVDGVLGHRAHPRVRPSGYGPAPCPTRRFPDGFRWGTATAAHQIEGGNVTTTGGAGSTRPGSGCKESSGDCCDSWHRWPEDVALLAGARASPTTASRSSGAASSPPRASSPPWPSTTTPACARRCWRPASTRSSPSTTSPRRCGSPTRAAGSDDDTPDRFAAYCERAAGRLGGADGAGLHDQRAEHGVHHRLPRRAPSRPASATADAPPPRQRGVRAAPTARRSTPSGPPRPACRWASRWP